MDVLTALKNHIKKEKASFHMPGHKNGAAFFGSSLYNDIFLLDTTELEGTDCLCAPGGFLLDAQKKAAQSFNADSAYFLVNGASGGILSMFYASFSEKDRVIVDRNCHKSAISAMTLSGAVPVYVTPEKNSELDVSGKISPEKIEELFKKHSDIKGVYITSPNYYGICSDVRKIAEIAHKNNAVLLVDEAHGAHFPFSRHFPENASESGADLSVVSLHKSLASPNQTALLLKKGNRISEERLKNAVNMFQTTSPSYILMAYSDAAIHAAREKGEELTEQFLEYQKGIKRLKTDDPFKLVISYKDKGISGGELEEILRKNFGIYAELSDHVNVLLMSSWGNKREDFELLRKALAYADTLPAKKLDVLPYPSFADSYDALSPKAVSGRDNEYVPAASAAGRICADTVAAFPPCIPLILPGEIITKEHVGFLMSFKGKITGITDNCIKVVRM